MAEPGSFVFLQRTAVGGELGYVSAPVSAKQEATMSALGALPTLVLRRKQPRQ